jgi:thioredoxin reductase (NADPH)
MAGPIEQKSAKVKLFGARNSPPAYSIRDFLQRSVVAFEWIELQNDEEARSLAHVDNLRDSRLPICLFPDGTRLESPTTRSVAEKLGWLTHPRHKEYDVSIYGAGPGGLSAAVYAASEGLKTVLIERTAIGGQAGTSSKIENYLGFPEGISGAELAERARQQAVHFGAEILLVREGIKAEFKDGKIVVDLASGGKLVARTNICATGVDYRHLNLPGEDRFLGAGVYYGAGVSEAPMCMGEQVYIVGGGNSAGQAAVHLSDYATTVTMLLRGDSLAATLSQYLVDKINATANIRVLPGARVTALHGESSLESISILDEKNGTDEIAETRHLFVCIGGLPNTEWAKDTNIIRDDLGYLVTGSDLEKDGNWPNLWTLDRQPYLLETSVPGSFAVGDVRHGSVKRVASAVGEGAMAVQFIHLHFHPT